MRLFLENSCPFAQQSARQQGDPEPGSFSSLPPRKRTGGQRELRSGGRLLGGGGLGRREAIPLLAAFLLNPRLGTVETGPLLPPSRAEQSRAVARTRPASPSSFVSPVFVLAESCSGLLRADSTKAKLEEPGHGATERGAKRGLGWGRRGGRAVGWRQTTVRTRGPDSWHGAQPKHHGASQAGEGLARS